MHQYENTDIAPVGERPHVLMRSRRAPYPILPQGASRDSERAGAEAPALSRLSQDGPNVQVSSRIVRRVFNKASVV
jgi:hypothetical protein